MNNPENPKNSVPNNNGNKDGVIDNNKLDNYKIKSKYSFLNPKRLLYKIYEKYLRRQIKDGIKPVHIGIIMDGNRRWARKIGLFAHMGHYYGVQKLKDVLRWAWDIGIKYITLYSFSTDNFSRPSKEVHTLMELFYKNIFDVINDSEIHEKKVSFRAIGRLNLLSPKLQEVIREAEKSTEKYKDRVLQVAISYGGRAEIIDAIKKILKELQDNNITPEEIDEELVSNFLYTKGIPDPDLIIRTSGEERLSGFMLWQSCYSELVFLDVYFPSMRKIDFWRAIRTFQQRNRRFGA
ncbi:MAG: polyprenyl diphosphate synthase [Promethearchaeota archaeon]